MSFRRLLQPLTAGGWLRTKPLDAILKEAEAPEHQMRRELGPLQLTLFGIGAIIGAGIFFTIGSAAAGDTQRPGAGPALIVSFLLTAIACGFTAFCYAEFAAMVPVSGSAYTYAYASLGELIAWIIGWDLLIEYAVGNIGVAISWANYFNSFLEALSIPGLGIDGIHIPAWLRMDYRSAAKLPDVLDQAPHVFGVPIVFNALAVAIILLITLVLVMGVRESAWFNAIMVSIKIVVLTFFIIVGTFWIKPENWTPFAPNGLGGISAGAAVVFFAYIGFDAVSTVAEETRRPQRDLPIAILGSLIICTVFYIVVCIVFTGMIPYRALTAQFDPQQSEPLVLALKYAIPAEEERLRSWTIGIVAAGSVVAHTAVLLVYQLGQPRIFMVMARDGLLPPVFGRIHPRYRTPVFSTILTSVFVAAFAAIADISDMIDLTNIGTLFAFILVCGGVLVLRHKDPHRPRPFRVWGGDVVPILGILSCCYLIYFLPSTSWLRFAAWLNCGFVIYIGYGVVHSGLTGRQLSDRPQEHDRQSSELGVWLALAGAVVLVLLHAVNVVLEGLKQHEQLMVALGDLRHVEPWLALPGGWRNETFWFLLVPLALNAYVLCPIILRRSLRAAGAGRTSTILAVALLLAATAYFGAIVAYNAG
jgi:APA family basic amino acid/polyamine antiporter